MRATVVLEHRFERTSDGQMWTSAGFDTRFWERYLEVFDGVRVVARVIDVPEPTPRTTQASGPGIEFEAIPHYIGPAQFALRYPHIRAAVRRTASAPDAFILRVPSFIGGLLVPALVARGVPYAVEVVGDPFDVFSPGAVVHPLRPLLRMWATGQLRRHCSGAMAASYVTQATLQQRYPCRTDMVAISDVRLEADAYVLRPRKWTSSARRLAFVGSLEQLYKAPDVLLAAVDALVSEGMDLHLTLIGDGRYRSAIESYPSALRLGARVHFAGWVPPGAAVQQHLDAADIFVLPSRTEGLPRAMLEAMARALPCIGSTAGGMRELLVSDYLARAGDCGDLCAKIRHLALDPRRMSEQSSRNLAFARHFANDVLRPRRRAYYALVRSRAEDALLQARRR